MSKMGWLLAMSITNDTADDTKYKEGEEQFQLFARPPDRVAAVQFRRTILHLPTDKIQKAKDSGGEPVRLMIDEMTPNWWGIAFIYDAAVSLLVATSNGKGLHYSRAASPASHAQWQTGAQRHAG